MGFSKAGLISHTHYYNSQSITKFSSLNSLAIYVMESASQQVELAKSTSRSTMITMQKVVILLVKPVA